MKPKVSRAGDKTKSNNYDRCQTPHYALDPILPYLPKSWIIWEPAAGDGQIVTKLELAGFDVVHSDLLTGHNFFDYSPPVWDCQVTNPPFSLKYKWLERCYQLGRPFALILPVETLGAATAQRLFSRYGIEVVLLDKRINFKMPFKGYNCSAQFPTAWFTCGLNIGQPLTFAQVSYYHDEQMPMFVS